MPDSLTYSVPLFLKRQCDRTLAEDPLAGPGGADKAALVRAARAQPSGELDYYDFETAWQVAP